MRITREKALQLRRLIELAVTYLDDEDALDGVELFPAWNGNGVSYVIGDRVRYDGVLYKVLQTHTSQSAWNPIDAHSLFARVLIPDIDNIPEWVQPSSTNPYMTGDKVTHNENTWISIVDNNVWEPGVYGWDIID